MRKVLKVREMREMLKVPVYDKTGFEVTENLSNFYSFFFAVLLVEPVEALGHGVPVVLIDTVFFHIGINESSSFLFFAKAIGHTIHQVGDFVEQVFIKKRRKAFDQRRFAATVKIVVCFRILSFEEWY